jgi:hypothetical protein
MAELVADRAYDDDKLRGRLESVRVKHSFTRQRRRKGKRPMNRRLYPCALPHWELLLPPQTPGEHRHKKGQARIGIPLHGDVRVRHGIVEIDSLHGIFQTRPKRLITITGMRGASTPPTDDAVQLYWPNSLFRYRQNPRFRLYLKHFYQLIFPGHQHPF